MKNTKITPTNNLTCPQCGLSHIKKNGLDCLRETRIIAARAADGRRVIREETVSDQKKKLINKLLLERISLRGICRVLDMRPLDSLQDYLRELYQQIPTDLNFQLPDDAEIELFLIEAKDAGKTIKLPEHYFLDTTH